MSQKTLSIKRIYVWSIFRALRSKPPKDYPTTGEIKATISDILPALKIHATEYFAIAKKAEDIANRTTTNELSAEESKVQIEAVNKEWREYHKAHGEEIVDLTLDGDAYKTLKDQFEREGWGREWLANVEEYGELLAAFEATSK